jgi:hypothetical protein
MPDLIAGAVVSFISGAAGLELVRWLLSRKERQHAEIRADDNQEFQQINDLIKQQNELRDEVRRDKADLKGEVSVLRAEVDTWRIAYFELYQFLVDIHQRHTMVVSYVQSILRWASERGLDIPATGLPLDIPPLPPSPVTRPRKKEQRSE